MDYNFSYFFDIYDRQFKITNDTKILNNGVNNINLISFFLASPEGNYHTEEIDLEALANENIEIPKEYNFNHLIPPIELYKEIIDEYCSIMDPRKLAPLQNQIKEKDNIISTLNQEKTMLQNELNSFPIKKQNLEIKNLEQDLKNKELQSCVLKKELGNKFVKNININYIDKNSAKSRIQNHLSYKLGQALITNSKSILGYIRMPFVLSYIKDKHKFEQKAYEEKIKENPNLALRPLEAYPDYKEALKEKECFTYKLGEAFIKASKNWYGGGYIKLWFEIRRLKGEFHIESS
ncbi:TPA: sugar transferase [Campylobacter jejuni]|nr:sugar transferase [Campylobacter jejuni]HDZ4264306.1 sugar transferase [Campylobacter jejuni]HED4577075.1 sugar transferase [Campylobacter jejuni]HED7664894.1 sugar transferase [Campylobacter jejuni]HEF7045463.1 sugar transferase [Campylobacter jejuni]